MKRFAFFNERCKDYLDRGQRLYKRHFITSGEVFRVSVLRGNNPDQAVLDDIPGYLYPNLPFHVHVRHGDEVVLHRTDTTMNTPMAEVFLQVAEKIGVSVGSFLLKVDEEMLSSTLGRLPELFVSFDGAIHNQLIGKCHTRFQCFYLQTVLQKNTDESDVEDEDPEAYIYSTEFDIADGMESIEPNGDKVKVELYTQNRTHHIGLYYFGEDLVQSVLNDVFFLTGLDHGDFYLMGCGGRWFHDDTIASKEGDNYTAYIVVRLRGGGVPLKKKDKLAIVETKFREKQNSKTTNYEAIAQSIRENPSETLVADAIAKANFEKLEEMWDTWNSGSSNGDRFAHEFAKHVIPEIAQLEQRIAELETSRALLKTAFEFKFVQEFMTEKGRYNLMPIQKLLEEQHKDLTKSDAMREQMRSEFEATFAQRFAQMNVSGQPSGDVNMG